MIGNASRPEVPLIISAKPKPSTSGMLTSDTTNRIGSSLNEEFPFECFEGECFIRDFLGELDDVRIFDEAFVPTEMSAEVDRATGDIRLKGGEFARDIQYYEIGSEEQDCELLN